MTWSKHDDKHVPQKNKSWKDVRKSTKNGAARYKHDVNIQTLEREAWKNGTKVKSPPNKNAVYKVYARACP